VHAAGSPHLTYCTNIHAGESWPDTRRNVEEHVVAVKKAVAPHVPFGVGLRLSGRAALTLAIPRELARFRALLAERGLYVFTINGFPYGAFHGVRVKERVYRPDWLEDARLLYTVRLGELLASLLPEDGALADTVGTVSTVPGAHRSRVTSPADAIAIGERLVRAAASFFFIRERTGKTIVLALEPEPCCYVESVDDAVEFFERILFSPAAARRFAALTGLSTAQADRALHAHIGVCFDACHMAVEFEDPKWAIQRLSSAGIAIAKIQISAGLEVEFPAEPRALEGLRCFANDVYSHQVVERRNGSLRRYEDLPAALATIEGRRADGTPALSPIDGSADRVWRVHFHVPVFLHRLGPLTGTQPYLRELLAMLRTSALCRHLEVETYTWDVLPEAYHRGSIVQAVARELEWVRGELER
jgi:sugar phosphate isomerase/epimerase